MTPDEARALLDGTTPGPWEWRWDTGLISLFDVEEEPVATDLDVLDADLIAAAPTLAATIAGMREEWGVAVTYPGLAEVMEWGFDTRDGADAEGSTLAAEYRIVRRYVTEPEEA